MLSIYLVRHGESTGNQENRWQGTAEYPLSELGVRQAECVAGYFAGRPLDAVITSPLARARQTAEIVARAIGCPLESDSRLVEYDVGELAGLRQDEIRDTYPAVFEALTKPGASYVAMPGEEGAEPFRRRIVAAWDHLRDRATSAGWTELAVVTHRAVMMSLVGTMLGLTPQQRSPVRFYNGSISRIDLTPGGAVIRSLNDTCHLRSGAPH